MYGAKMKSTDILGSDAEIFSDYFGINSKGNWEPGKNIPDINEGNKNTEKKYNIPPNNSCKKSIL